MKHSIVILLSLLVFYSLQAQGQNRGSSPIQSPDSVFEDTLQFKLPPPKLNPPAKQEQVSPFPGIRDHAQMLSDWNKLRADTVSAEQQQLQRIVRLAVLAMPKNNPDKPHQMEGFYRMVGTEDDRYTKLIEAAVTIQDTDYKTVYNCDNLKVRLKHLRQSSELGKIDSATIKGARAFVKNAPKAVNNNYLYRLNQINLLRGSYIPMHIFNVEGWLASEHYFKLTDVHVAGTDTLYTIAFKSKGDPRYSSGYLTINSSDHAIIEYQRANYVSTSFTGRIHMKCRKQEGKYYPESIRYEFPRIINDDIGEHQLDIHTLWIGTVVSNQFKEIKSRDQIDCDQEVQTFIRPYDLSFWTSYKMLQLHPLEPEIKVSLETSGSLESQFISNASK